ncbi:hypothetical protein Tco_0670206 [Tanacetum coccineum]
MTSENKEHFQSEKEAIFLLLTGIGDEIYLTVDACNPSNEMWIAMERLQQGESLNVQDVKTNLFWEFGKFTSRECENHGVGIFSRFYICDDLCVTRNNLQVTTMQVNVQFLQQLQPEWSRFVTVVKQSKEIDTISYHTLFDILKQYQNEVNDIRSKRLARSANLLALLTAAQPYLDNYYQAQKTQTISMQTSSSTRPSASTDTRHRVPKPVNLNMSQCLRRHSTNLPSNNLRNFFQTPGQDEDTTPKCNRLGYSALTARDWALGQGCREWIEEIDDKNWKALYSFMAKIQSTSTEYLYQLERAKEVRKTMWRKPFVRTKPNIAKNVAFLPVSESISKSRQVFNDMTFNINQFIEIVDQTWRKHTSSCFRVPTAHDMELLIKTLLMPLSIKSQNDSFRFEHELKTEMHEDFEYVKSLENEVDELESEKADFSNMYDLLIEECVSKDVICSYLHSMSELNAHTELQCMYLHKVQECECLAQKLSKQTE